MRPPLRNENLVLFLKGWPLVRGIFYIIIHGLLYMLEGLEVIYNAFRRYGALGLFFLFLVYSSPSFIRPLLRNGNLVLFLEGWPLVRGLSYVYIIHILYMYILYMGHYTYSRRLEVIYNALRTYGALGLFFVVFFLYSSPPLKSPPPLADWIIWSYYKRVLFYSIIHGLLYVL